MTGDIQDEEGENLTGVRDRADTEAAYAALQRRTPGGEASSPYARGAGDVLRWALGSSHAAPVTAVAVDGVPSLQLLAAELDAALVELEACLQRGTPEHYPRGVLDTLAWLSGQRDERP
jgi:hypothetical protein